MPLSPDIRPDPYRPPTREQIEKARAMYAQGFTVSRCLAAADMSLGTFYYWLDGGPRELEGPLYPPLARRRKVAAKRRAPLPADRVSLAARLWRTTERQARDIEERLSRPQHSGPERERDVRMLASLVRSLRELSGFDSGSAPGDENGRAEPSLAAAQELAEIRAARAELMRDVDRRVATVRHMVSYLRDIRKIEAMQKQRAAALDGKQADKAKEEAEQEEFRRKLARSIEGIVATRAAKREGGAE